MIKLTNGLLVICDQGRSYHRGLGGQGPSPPTNRFALPPDQTFGKLKYDDISMMINLKLRNFKTIL